MKLFKQLFIFGLLGYLMILLIVVSLSYNLYLFVERKKLKSEPKKEIVQPYTLDNSENKVDDTTQKVVSKKLKPTPQVAPQVAPQVKDSFTERKDSTNKSIDSLKTP